MKNKEIKGICPDCKKELIGTERTEIVTETWEDGTIKYYRRGSAASECPCGYIEGGPVSEYLGTEEEYIAKDDFLHSDDGEDHPCEDGCAACPYKEQC